MKILVTGGAGFIGSHFIKHLLNKYDTYKVINADCLTYAANLSNLYEIENDPRYTFVKVDITDEELVNQIVSQGIDYIVNFAAESHVDRSILEPGQFIKTNVLGTQVLLDAAKRYNIKKFLQISTDEVYGSLGDEGFFTESTPIAPNSPYSASKASADLLVRAYYKTYGMSVNITRCSNNYGPNQLPEKLIPLMICHAKDNKSLPIYGTGLNIRDWIHVKDHCRAIDIVLHQGSDGEIYNIGGNTEKTNIDIIICILKIMDKDESLITYVNDRLGHDYRYAINNNKIKEQFGWEPVINFNDGLEETVRWYQNNQKWCIAARQRLKEYYRNMYKEGS